MVPDHEAKEGEGNVESGKQIESLKDIDKKEEEGEGEACVIQTFMRPETEDEMARRIQEEA